MLNMNYKLNVWNQSVSLISAIIGLDESTSNFDTGYVS